MTTTQTVSLPCRDRIREQMESREALVKAMTEQAEGTEYYGDEESLYELALSIDIVQITKVCLSYGGPADYLEIEHDSNGVRSMEYRFSDWFDTATLEVEEGTYLWNYGVMILDSMAQ